MNSLFPGLGRETWSVFFCLFETMNDEQLVHGFRAENTGSDDLTSRPVE
jgi:hypothetical protein